MACQNTSRNVRPRTYWTPTMERYFIDLMLEHMHRGDRSGHTFNKQAWTDMLAVFNAKFGSQFDKDVLKSHYTNLWKQFNDIKNLLGHNGFSWDETKEMVVADDYVWDAYIKAHPDVRLYKTRAVLNFNDLCLIYGYTIADGRYSRSSHDIDIEDEGQGVNSGDEIGSLIPANSERSRTGWIPAMDQYFIELMLNQQEKGNKLENTFSKQAWTDMLTSFNVKFGPHHNKRVLRHRYKKLWKYYSDISLLLKQNGFSWEETQQMITASDDDWDAYIKAHPHARSYRMKTLPNFKDLGLIFGDAINSDSQSDLPKDKKLEDDIIGVKTGSERSRTFWTPPMDRYFIDLLLDQVHRGNRIGQTFNSQAWFDMVTSFNANFRSHHDKDVLKNRYKHLRRQYNEVKILLEQVGFSWDEKREMVTAEDHIWDVYIKGHPDARSYRVKTVPSYHKLCVIYGQDNSDGRYSRLARNVDPDSVYLMTGEWKDDQSPASTDLIVDWTPSMDRCFIDLMLEQVHRGNKIDKTFDVQAWAHMVASFNEKLGLQYDRYVLETRYICLMQQYTDINSLLNQNGFAWDETQHIVAADDEIWEGYIKEHPNAISYRNKILQHYNDLCVIFGIGLMDGRVVCQTLVNEFDHGPLGMEINKTSQLKNPVMGKETPSGRKKRSAVTPSASGRSSKLQKTGKDIQKSFSDMETMVTKLVNKKADKNHITIESAIDALQAIPDIDDELLLDACDLLEDEKKAKTFLALDATLRKKWLRRKLGR